MNPTYPWHKTERGQGFFVPGLDVMRIRREGLSAAIRYRFRGEPQAVIGIRDGKLGVMFFRKPLVRRRPSESSPA